MKYLKFFIKKKIINNFRHNYKALSKYFFESLSSSSFKLQVFNYPVSSMADSFFTPSTPLPDGYPPEGLDVESLLNKENWIGGFGRVFGILSPYSLLLVGVGIDLAFGSLVTYMYSKTHYSLVLGFSFILLFLSHLPLFKLVLVN